jgi:hypothetical protein
MGIFTQQVSFRNFTAIKLHYENLSIIEIIQSADL